MENSKLPKKIDLYGSAESYLEAPEGMKNEVQMWFVAAGLLMQEISKKMGCKPYGGLKQEVGYTKNQQIESLTILDVCSGLANFVNHLSFVLPKLHAVCIDNNRQFLEYSKKKFANWLFIEDDATNFSLDKKFDVITASSAYHHIDDGSKQVFLNNLSKHLTNDGIILVCENFLPNYQTPQEKAESIRKYYGELQNYYKNGNSTEQSLKAITQVEYLEGTIEQKVSFRVFKEQIANAKLFIDSDVIVWQPGSLQKDNAGSHVLILKKRENYFI
jgi:ubiquinone/menaquinone biosynthesis C-methylase UbiE